MVNVPSVVNTAAEVAGVAIGDRQIIQSQRGAAINFHHAHQTTTADGRRLPCAVNRQRAPPTRYVGQLRTERNRPRRR